MRVRKKTSRGASWSVPLAKYYSADKIKNNEMGGACSRYGKRKGGCRV
jgi:hypothetical protein